MLKKRLIPVLLLRNGVIVQSKRFSRYQRLGDPTTIVQRLSNWHSDELIYLDISQNRTYDLGRDDLRGENRHSILEILQDVSKCCFMPLTFGGGIRSIKDIHDRVRLGADKVSINSQAIQNPDFINECAREFGSQSIVVSIDVKRHEDGSYEVYRQGGKQKTGRDPVLWASEVESRGGGEILLNSIDRDGTGEGFDLILLQAVALAVNIPVIACGGVGDWAHLAEAVIKTRVNAVAAANIFNYSENSVYMAKKYLFDSHLDFRKPTMGCGLNSSM